MTETELQALCNQYMRDAGITFFHLPKGRYNGQKAMNVGGLPDLLIWNNGRHALIELKVEGGTLNKKQIEFFTDLWEAGHEVHICRSFDQFVETIKKLGVG